MTLVSVGSKKDRPLPIVAIDGPAGAGKSTAARLLAAQLGFTLIDTGALYRGLALMATEKNIPLDNKELLAAYCSTLKFTFGTLDKPQVQAGMVIPPKLHVYCNSIEITDSIRTPELGMIASNISKHPEVRQALLDVQRSFGDRGGIVMEGRDIGTVIFPDAEVKFFLTASVESRSKRRCEELLAMGIQRELSQVIRETQARDEQDMNRPVAPLKQAPGATLIDSTSKTLDQVVADMAEIVRRQIRS